MKNPRVTAVLDASAMIAVGLAKLERCTFDKELTERVKGLRKAHDALGYYIDVRLE